MIFHLKAILIISAIFNSNKFFYFELIISGVRKFPLFTIFVITYILKSEDRTLEANEIWGAKCKKDQIRDLLEIKFKTCGSKCKMNQMLGLIGF